jgi:uncharacterized membrane protein (UPF0127 family)
VKYFYLICFLILFQVSCYAGDLREDAKISFIDSVGKKSDLISVEIAKTEPERSKGLMYRRELRDKTGMFFIMPDDAIQSFWMKNTYIPLDIIFIKKDGVVDSILRSVPPLTLTSRKSKGISKYVLELSGGSAEKLGVIEGSKIEVVDDRASLLHFP